MPQWPLVLSSFITACSIFAPHPCLAAQTTYQVDPSFTPTARGTPSPISATILRPSAGETVTGGQPYTVTWSPAPPLPQPLMVELEISGPAFSYLYNSSYECNGWLVNPRCGKIALNIPSGTTWVWDVPFSTAFANHRLDVSDQVNPMSLRIYDPGRSSGWSASSGDFHYFVPTNDSLTMTSSRTGTMASSRTGTSGSSSSMSTPTSVSPSSTATTSTTSNAAAAGPQITGYAWGIIGLAGAFL
ncbi:hypothetical protein AJ80_07404 [Polytolypa hystricis UAMH7299]|uniref:Uncharacterized protein n=1 Tax=Polytolypa hystricis (strain UAMH7299) TaxID=1447883 RepID=A0A2B7XGA0_POLH7|nr:hypothetical protein AJ80_07404 [Polytolypa hystricis UAMH7299]